MKKEIIISGFGGQGVLSMGKILAYSGLMENKEVTWMPAYGPEQRGGTANVTVIVSEERISSPILSKYDVAIVLNQPSLDKFEEKVKPGGILIYDGYGIINPPTRKDINVYRIDAMDKAAEMIRIIATDFEEGMIFKGKVVSIKEFGAFIEFAPGKEGLVHISKICKERIDHVEDVLTRGDVVKCVCLGKDKMGRYSFSIKDVKED